MGRSQSLTWIGILAGVFAGCGSSGAAAGPTEAGTPDGPGMDAAGTDEGDAGASPCSPSEEATNDGGCVAVVPVGGRTLGLEVDNPAGLDYPTEVDVAMGIGVRAVPITLPWPTIEKSPKQIDPGWFQALNVVYATRSDALLLSIPLVDTVSVLAPTDLAPQLTSGSLAFDDPTVISRYEALLDALFATLDPRVTLRYLLVANEENIFLASKPDAMWTSLADFFQTIKAYVAAKRSGVVVGMNVAFVGLTDAVQRPKVQTLDATADQVFVSYYAGDNGFGQDASTTIPADIDTMIAFAGARPLVLKEFGYATGTMGHDPNGQVAFVTDLFQSWDAHASQIPTAIISRMFDGNPPDCAATAQAYGFGGNQEFIAFLCTLGVRTYADAPKVAWTRLADATKLRGF